jgi:excinuclease ABC subunit C
MGRCFAPCSKSLRGKQDRERYLEIVNEVKSFIMGEKKGLLDHLQERMKDYSDNLRYEEAAKIRDRLNALEKAWESQGAIAPDLGDIDVIGLYREKQEASIYMLFIRNGTIIGQKDFFLKKLGDIADDELIESFVQQFYAKEMLLPPRIVLPLKADMKIQKQWLSSRRGKAVRLSYANKDAEKKVLKMADENAVYAFNRHKETRVDDTLLNIKKILDLDVIPRRMGAIDISNISGSEAVGALVFFDDGKFNKDEYRLFRIKTVKGADDFAMMGEVVSRYLQNLSDGKGTVPELVLVDGGRGQLESALHAAKPFDLPLEIAAIAKAKKRVVKNKETGVRADLERVYLPGRKMPVYLDPMSASTHLMQKIRDEVHRSAISYHRKLRAKRTLASPLEKVEGIGKTRRLALLKHFGSIDGIRKASVDDIASLKGMNRKVAESLKKELVEGAKAQSND